MSERDYVLVCYPSDPIEPGETVDNPMRGYESAWHALRDFALMMMHHPNPMIPTRIDIMTREEWQVRKLTRKGGTAG